MRRPVHRVAVADHFGDSRADTVLETCGECGAVLVAGMVGDPDETVRIDTRDQHKAWHKNLARTIEANDVAPAGRYGGRR